MLNPRPGVAPRVLESRLLRFLFAGGFAAACNFGSRFLYSLYVEFGVAVVLAFVTGLTVGFLLNKFFVFTNSRNSAASEVFWFVLVNLLALAQTWLISVYFADYLEQLAVVQSVASPRALAEAIAHGTGVVVPVFTSYLGHRYVTFRE